MDTAATIGMKVRRNVLPLLMVGWFVAWLLRFNVSFAALQMNDALGFSAAVFGLAGGLFFIGYAVFEVPSNLVLARVGARRWLGVLMVASGLIGGAMLFVREPTGFYVLRFLLGAAEAGCFPGMAYYLSQWLTPRERSAAIGLLGSMAMASGVVGAPLAGALLALNGWWGLSGWQWLFLIEAIPAVAVGVCILKYLPENPDRVSWLSDEERAWLRTHIHCESTHLPTRQSLQAVVANPLYWTLGLAFLGCVAAGSGLRLFQPIILREVGGLPDVWAATFSSIPALASLAAIVYVGRRSTRVDERYWHAAVPMFVAALGLTLVGVTQGLVGVLIVAALASVGVGAQPPLFSTVSAVTSGSVNAVGIAFVNSLGALGAFIGPYVVGYLIDAQGGLAMPFALAGATMALAGIVVLAGREVARVSERAPKAAAGAA